VKREYIFVIFCICTLSILVTPPALAQTIFVANMSGFKVVPPVYTTAQGTAKFIFDQPVNSGRDLNAINYDVSAGNIHNILQLLIHKAPPGKNGPVVVNLTNDPKFSSFRERFVMTGNLSTETDNNIFMGPLFAKVGSVLNVLGRNILENNTYVDIRTKDYPHGEIRGDIVLLQNK
jgi:hypothetical protein